MVDVLRKSIYFVIGLDFINRKRAVEKIQSRIIDPKNSCLNTHIYYSEDIDRDNLRNLLFSFSFGGKKVVIFKEVQKLLSPIKDFLYNNIQKIITNNYLIFELNQDCWSFKQNRRFAKDKFFIFLFKQASVYKLASSRSELSLKYLMNLIRDRRLTDALYSLENIFNTAAQENILGMQILGALSRNASYLYDLKIKKKYFNLIWNTERELKEGKLSARLSLELLIVKLI